MTSEQFFATSKSRWVIRVCGKVVNFSICNCKGIIIFNQNSTLRTFCTQKVVVVVGLAFQTGTNEVKPTTHVAPQKRTSVWSYTQPFLTVSAEPFLRPFVENYTQIVNQLLGGSVSSQILRAPTDSDFWSFSVWTKCLPTEIVEGQVSLTNWGFAWAIA